MLTSPVIGMGATGYNITSVVLQWKLHMLGSLIVEIYPNDPNSFEKVNQGLLTIAWYGSNESQSRTGAVWPISKGNGSQTLVHKNRAVLSNRKMKHT